MKSVNKLVKLGARLQKIKEMISHPYTHIWDCCCDHGLLGFDLMTEQLAETVHFVDIVPELLNKIKLTLDKHWQGDRKSWQVHCIDASELPVKQFSLDVKLDKHLIIIAGVGGDLMIELLASLKSLSTNYDIEYILCPVHHNYKVRKFLIDNHFSLINESLVFEKQRGYEILHVSTAGITEVSEVGSLMWDLKNLLHLDYLNKTIAHYKRLSRNPKNEVSDIISQYQALLLD